MSVGVGGLRKREMVTPQGIETDVCIEDIEVKLSILHKI
jgi:hypothetical protein